MEYKEIIKNIKDAVVANGIEVNLLSHVMWDVCKNEYKFFINENVNFYYKFPNGETCTNFNPSFNLQDFMSTSDEDLVEEFNKQCEENKWELDNMKDYYSATTKYIMIKEIAKSIYDAIQVEIESGYCSSFLNFCFNENGEFERYFFTDDVFDSTCDELKWGGIEREEYVNMSIEDIEEELNYIQDKDGKIALAHKDFLERLAKQEKLPF